jgi:hypothetical protein
MADCRLRIANFRWGLQIGGLVLAALCTLPLAAQTGQSIQDEYAVYDLPASAGPRLRKCF